MHLRGQLLDMDSVVRRNCKSRHRYALPLEGDNLRPFRGARPRTHHGEDLPL